ncbi:hypothetical protein [Acetanaerobacterium elongatum]|nr:hypothetical protein [Acetanaerobacterium elongatum]
MKESLKGSKLLTISPEGKVVKAVSYPGQCLSNARLSPNGRYMLCQTDIESGGESFNCDYIVIDLQTGKQYRSPDRQSGYQNHIILSDNLIGYAEGTRINGPEQNKPIKLYDMQYRPLDIALAFDSGKRLVHDSGESYDENSITGIGYNPHSETYYVTYAKDLSLDGLKEGEYQQIFSQSRMGIAVFNKNGIPIDNRYLPKEYSAPYSGNVLWLIPNSPVVLPDGWLVVSSIKNYKTNTLLLINPNGWEVKELNYQSHNGCGLTDKLLPVYEYQLPQYPNTTLLGFQNGTITAKHELPVTVKAGLNEFEPFEIEWKDNKGYFLAIGQGTDWMSIYGLFFWDGTTAKLNHLLPIECNLVGIDSEGNSMVLLDGATPLMAEEYENFIVN